MEKNLINRPAFWLISGRDFARSIAWAKTQPRLRELAVRAAKGKA